MIEPKPKSACRFDLVSLGTRWLHTGGIFAALSDTTPLMAKEAMIGRLGVKARGDPSALPQRRKLMMKHWISVVSLWLIAFASLPRETFARPRLFDIHPLSDRTVETSRLFEYQVTYGVIDTPCWVGGLSFELTSAPNGMTITRSGTIQWTPSSSEVGSSHQVTVHATAPTPPGSPCNGVPGQDSESFSVTVVAPDVAGEYTATGSVRTHNLEPPTGLIPVTVSIVNTGTCTRRTVAHYTAFTDTNGNYSISWNPPAPGEVACFNPYYGFTFFYSVLVSAFGDETKATTGTEATFDASGALGIVGDDVTRHFVNAPDLVSANGHWWARRIGPLTGSPVIDIEGFDPSNGFSSELRASIMGCSSLDDQECDLSCLTEPGETRADCDFGGSPNNLRDYLVANGYTLWLLLSGPNGGDTLKGSSANNYTDGGIYQAMNITKKILDLSEAKVGSVLAALHGYSMGGVVARAGLRHWCDAGTWESTTLGDLRLTQSECYKIGLWISGDAPLEGGLAPRAAMRYIKDLSVDPGVLASINSDAAREMLVQWVTDGCSTSCADPGGCTSSESDFVRGCSVDNSVFADFQNWAKGTGYAYPRYADATPIPGIAYSQGQSPGARPGNAYSEFIKTSVTNSNDHHLLFNTAGDACNFCGNMEWVNGSLNNSAFKAIHGTSGSGGILGGLIGDYEVSMLIIPPFISTASALDWDSDLSQWWDYRYNNVNAFHAGPVYKEANQMVLAWVHEHLKGDRSISPICTGFRTVGQKATCRPSPFAVTALAPSFVTQKATYSLTGSGSAPAYDWKWERSFDGGPWESWSVSQNSEFVAYAGTYTIEWRLSARRNSDGALALGYAATRVCIPSTSCAPDIP